MGDKLRERLRVRFVAVLADRAPLADTLLRLVDDYVEKRRRVWASIDERPYCAECGRPGYRKLIPSEPAVDLIGHLDQRVRHSFVLPE